MLFSSFRDGSQEVYSMNADGAGVIRLTNSPGHDDYAVWSPDGKRIAFTSNRDGQATGADLYLMNIDGTQIKRLTTTGSSTYPSWEPHGRLISVSGSIT